MFIKILLNRIYINLLILIIKPQKSQNFYHFIFYGLINKLKKKQINK